MTKVATSKKSCPFASARARASLAMVFIKTIHHELRVEDLPGAPAKNKTAAVPPRTLFRGQHAAKLSSLDLLEAIGLALSQTKRTDAQLFRDLEPYHVVKCVCCAGGTKNGGFNSKLGSCIQWQKLSEKLGSFIREFERLPAGTETEPSVRVTWKKARYAVDAGLLAGGAPLLIKVGAGAGDDSESEGSDD